MKSSSFKNLLSLTFIALVLLSGCKSDHETGEEAPMAETSADYETGEEAPTPMEGEMSTDYEMGEQTPMEYETPTATPEPEGPIKVVWKKEEIAANFPNYDAAAAAGKVKPITVFYATDRQPTNSKDPRTAFGPDRSREGQLHWGTCVVSIPKTHKLGAMEGTGTLVREEDPLRHIVLTRLSDLSRDLFIATLHTSVTGAPKKELLVFVHGFNVEFKDAARRTAQLAFDLEFEGIPVFYSWPAQGDMTPAKYRVDRENSRWTVPRLELFLRELAQNSGATAIHLVAHSMGADALTQALSRLSLRLPDKLPMFGEVVLAAPDVDRASFLQFADDFKRAGKRFTLYASSKDKALRIAKRINKFDRAGDSGPGVVLIPGIDTIDVSGVDKSVVGHFYYGSNPPILADMASLIKEGKDASDRFRLDKQKKDGMTYWIVRP